MTRGRMAYVDLSWDDVFASAPILPHDARLNYLRLNDERRTVRAFFAAASLDIVPEGEPIPEYVASAPEAWPE